MHPAIIKFVPNKATLLLGKATLQVSKQSPHILFGVGLVGFGATIYMSSKAVLKLDKEIDKIKGNVEDVKALKQMHQEAEADGVIYPKGHDFYYSESHYRKDLAYCYLDAVLKIGKMYGPTVLVGIGTVACLTKSHQILTNRNTALMAAYSVLERSYNAYRKRVVDEFGEDKDRELQYPTKEIRTLSLDDKGKAVEKVETKTLLDQYSSYARFFDEMCADWKRNPEYNLIFLRAQQNWANDLLRARGHVFLNEVYDMLGIPRTKAGAVVGWVIGHDGDNYIDFGLFDGENSAARDFVNGRERSILLDFNVDGVIYDKIGS
jgi:hypothetical protein